MNLTLLLLDDDLFRDIGTDIPVLGMLIMLLFALFLLWFRSKRNLNSKINILADDISLLKETDVLGFEKGNNGDTIPQNPREIGVVGKVLALAMVILFLLVPVYVIFERIL